MSSIEGIKIGYFLKLLTFSLTIFLLTENLPKRPIIFGKENGGKIKETKMKHKIDMPK